MCEAMPRWSASFASSAEDQRDKGLPDSTGRVQARAVIWARWAEGKKARDPGPRPVGEGGHLLPAAAPGSNRPIGASHVLGDRAIVPVRMFVGQQDALRTYHLRMTDSCPRASHALKLFVCLIRKRNNVGRFGAPWHMPSSLLRRVPQFTMRGPLTGNSERISCQVY